MQRFLSTPSARRATQVGGHRGRHKWISIHALREEGDGVVLDECSWLNEFLSTPSARRATKTPRLWYTRGDISIHALREEGDRAITCARVHVSIFLSTPSARRATLFISSFVPPLLFLSTPSARRATILFRDFCLLSLISIHALREEGDKSCFGTFVYFR